MLDKVSGEIRVRTQVIGKRPPFSIAGILLGHALCDDFVKTLSTTVGRRIFIQDMGKVYPTGY